ncbi:hypothetical protein HX52_25420 [Salmonella enterica]|nr:hypothetical protein [Salmonella enterica]EDL3530377.1 hypothetical protein [Salmonella enterica subsp. enterica serovar Newport]EDU6134600.1 hypothetical protein [Salmonella enterica subsp. enterica]EBA1892407.1 hypothetical protein [Salmonella enterica]EBL7700999.1 hypothetical protein [Salmonella enterica]
MSEDFYRKEALDFRREKQTITPVIVPSANTGIIAGVFVCIVITSVVLSLPYTERVPARGVVMPGNGVVDVRTVAAGVIDGINIAPGDYVHKGDIILSISANKK